MKKLPLVKVFLKPSDDKVENLDMEMNMAAGSIILLAEEEFPDTEVGDFWFSITTGLFVYEGVLHRRAPGEEPILKELTVRDLEAN